MTLRKVEFLSAAIILFFSACTKIETTTVGAGLIPPVDNVTTFDTTLDVFTSNSLDLLRDSLKIYKAQDQVIGYLNDPLFGKTTASLYLELKPMSYPQTFPATARLYPDSAVLVLSYRGFYGDSAQTQQWKVKEVTSEIIGDTTYNVSASFGTGAEYANQQVDIRKFGDSVHARFEDAADQIRIRLSSALAQHLIVNDTSTTSIYKNDSAFRNFFKGLYVTPVAGMGNALVRINLLDTNTKLALYYRYNLNDTAAHQDTGVTYFRFSRGFTSTVSGAANHVDWDNSGSQFQTALNSQQYNDSLVFIKTAPGTHASVSIPGLSALPNSIIHLAQLQMYEEPEVIGAASKLTPPSLLLLSAYDTANHIKINVPNDFYVSPSTGTINTSVFGGEPKKVSVSGYGDVTSYMYNISRYVQGVVTRQNKNYTLMLSAPVADSMMYTEPYPSTTAPYRLYFGYANANQTAIGRVRLGGGKRAATNPLRMRLRIIYSKI